jgi:hypothetical protein
LSGRNGTVLRQLLDSLGQLIGLAQQDASTIQPLGFLCLAGAGHMSQQYNRI